MAQQGAEPVSEGVRKLLLVTAGCDSTDVGEAWSAHQWAKGLAQRFDVTLLNMRRRHRPPAGPQLLGVRVIDWLDWPLIGRFERFNSMLSPGYVGFYLWVRRWVRAAARGGERFDLAHQLSPLAPRYPSPLDGLNIPYVLGPLGGSLTTPESFAHETERTAWFVRLRALDAWRLRHDAQLRSTMTGAEVVLGVAPYVQDLLADIPVKRFAIASETGVVQLPAERRREQGQSGTLRMLFVGRAVRTKGLRDAVRAMAHLRDLPGVSLDVVGDGEDMPACRQEAATLGVGDRIRFHGRQPRAEVERFYADADVFFFPSFREASGNVVFESLSHGLPAIVADRGGPGYVVDSSCGLRVPVTDPYGYARDLAGASRILALDPQLRLQLSAGARKRIESIALWDHKIASMAELYSSLDLNKQVHERGAA